MTAKNNTNNGVGAIQDNTFVQKTADQIKQMILLDIAMRYKGVDPIIDKKIDAAASQIVGRDGISFIPEMVDKRGSVPFYLEGEPGVGKTSVITAAIKEFCDIAGLRFVENPPSNYVLKEDDFYFCSVNLSGKTNAMDLGGIPMKHKMGSQSYIEELNAKIEDICAHEGLPVKKLSDTSSSLRTIELHVGGDTDLAMKAISSAIKRMSVKMKEEGIPAPVGLDKDEEALEDKLSYKLVSGPNGIRISLNEKISFKNEDSYVVSMLPNMRFKFAEQAKFAFFNFDDVANAGPSVRNTLLEVAQSGRYSGVMDLNGAMVSFTGNIGAEDNTNVMSQQSDAEVSRVKKFRISDTPKDWARRETELCSNQPGGDCLFASFIDRQGIVEGIFRPKAGDRGKKGVPKSNSRSLQNARREVQKYYIMAEHSGINPLLFEDDIFATVSACCGSLVANTYMAHVKAMMSDAIPLAEDLIQRDNFDAERFSDAYGDGRRPGAGDFGYRFAFSVADEFVKYINENYVKDSSVKNPESVITEASKRMCIGVSRLTPSMATSCFSRVALRLSKIPALQEVSPSGYVHVKSEFYTSMAHGFLEASKSGKAEWGSNSEKDLILRDLTEIMTGSRSSSTNKKSPKA